MRNYMKEGACFYIWQIAKNKKKEPEEARLWILSGPSPYLPIINTTILDKLEKKLKEKIFKL